jgi:hypothetical protein
MDSEAFLADLKASTRTELDRLGSEKVLLALTGADLSTETVLARAMGRDAAVAAVYRSWADDAGDPAAAAFVSAADRLDDHCAQVDVEPAVDGEDAATVALRSIDGTAERVAAGLVAYPLVRDRTLLQVVSFFVNEADERRADLFRSFREATETAREDGLATLDAVATDAEVAAAEAAAAEFVTAVYEDYAERLRAMGMDPKPVC